jgi:hypothetical protein
MSAKLYHAASDLMAHLAIHGEIDVRHDLADAVLAALDDMDGGQYNKNFGKRTRKPKPIPADLLEHRA